MTYFSLDNQPEIGTVVGSAFAALAGLLATLKGTENSVAQGGSIAFLVFFMS